MKKLHFDLSMGAAGDMLTAALLELTPNPAAFTEKLNAAGIPGVTFRALDAETCGVRGTRMEVLVNGEEEDAFFRHAHGHDHEHTHRHAGLAEIEHVFAHMRVSDAVRANATAVYRLIAEAESKVHGVPVTEVHFHEVGALDAVADVTAVCMLMEALAPDSVTASPVHVGSGTVRCAHGILPVPAPAAAELLRGIPTYGGEIKGELCTPTGAALLKHFVSAFGPQPLMTVKAIGCGIGKKEFPAANCVRAMLGETENAGTDKITELNFQVDDMTAEGIAFACEQLLAAGAKDVFCTAVLMKKGRPGTLVTVLAAPGDKEKLLRLIYRHTTTLGVRETLRQRTVLNRREETIETPYGPVRKKISEGWGCVKDKPEYDDLARIAAEQGISLSDVRKTIEK